MHGESDLYESVWKRGWRDFKSRLGSPVFWLAEVLGGGLIAKYGDPLLALVFVVGIALVVWFGATASARIKQRDEYRATLRQQQSTQPDVKIYVDSSLSGTGYLVVKNSGSTGTFTALCTVLEMRNPTPHRIEDSRIGTFKMKWDSCSDKYMCIQAGDSERLLLGRLTQCEPGQRGSIGLVELRDNDGFQYDGYDWKNKQGELHPEWDVKVDILEIDRRKYSESERFRVSVSTVHDSDIPQEWKNLSPWLPEPAFSDTFREVVADELAAAADEDGVDAADQACALLLAVAGRRALEPEAVRSDGAEDCCPTGA